MPKFIVKVEEQEIEREAVDTPTYLRAITGWHEASTWPSICPVLSVVVISATASIVALIWR